MRRFMRAAARAIAAAIAALLAPRMVAAALLIAGIALVAEAVRELIGPAYATLTWGFALILLAILISRGASRA